MISSRAEAVVAAVSASSLGKRKNMQRRQMQRFLELTASLNTSQSSTPVGFFPLSILTRTPPRFPSPLCSIRLRERAAGNAQNASPARPGCAPDEGRERKRDRKREKREREKNVRLCVSFLQSLSGINKSLPFYPLSLKNHHLVLM